MIRRRLSWLTMLPLSICTVLVAAALAASQDPPQAKQATAQPPHAKKAAAPDGLSDPAKRKALIDKMIADYDLTPHPAPPIPDNPPPHEGALITLPFVVAPPDLVLVEVLDALPGRPISGERLVRPDGTISLGFYGDVQVRGLSLLQMKVAIIKHLRSFLTDESLGLVSSGDSDEPAFMDDDAPLAPQRHPTPKSPNGAQSPSPAPKQKTPLAPPPRPAPGGPFDQGVDGDATASGPIAIIPPEKSLLVYVDTTAYNTMNYYVTGDVQVTGKLPYTGNETILDAIYHAGGLVATADPKEVRLVRPGRGGKPSQTYKVDLQAIEERGDVTTNYQIFPGDRLCIGRSEVVKKTVEIDRLAAPMLSVVGAMLQEAFMLRAMQTAGGAEHADALYKELLDFWLKQLSSRGELKFDEQTLREALLRHRKLPPPGPAPK
jgi:polysaccharide export outer membrane protein